MSDEFIPDDQFKPDEEALTTALDPTSGAAAPGLQKLSELPIVKKAIDFGGNLDQYGNMVKGAMAGDPAMAPLTIFPY
jgi:hypothetical protein